MKDVLKPNGLGLKRVFKASYCSYLGFKAAFKEEVAFRQELLLCIILLPLSFWLASSLLHWALLVSTLLIMLIVELLNSAIEALTDRVSTERHVLSGRAKDMGSAAVTLALSIVVIIWGISLYIKIV
ncbi:MULTISPECIES: diacylglycerol kinase [Pseudoalteromonas]|jgi:diacylglycerol kinase (ATP)|uniref:Diacylglycerol kinase n=2 Tax=Pseudoalteromonas TaxID=53246 RepID=Q3IJI2_PSET1|nr:MULTISPECIES: diacylglycerol kinase [Pseudoalteromonas]ASM55425.1 diacylglycerol kinase (ATP dependent) [Pseudoalteromonas nigrifaciens]MBB1372540.1 diacylglycerol kinase [Pseudoalteromonas sp. SR45-4]MBB1407436.1 diacylglycerol kinase [Pseudoalteromonas sp. SG44-5]MBE0421784.1 diacylglycerol kinase [Pseudoalteromonas nigrifaciens]MBH0073845.1 diacylglycerol kinase [Pseudoalteromonas sp. NZS127]|tara:strand:+ start:12981 stop:13361 length:381 start_codon:yes stop_codon:yes gene_type:complete